MKKVLAAVGVFAFLLVLLVKPFEILDVYSEHAGRVAHSVTAEGYDSPAPLAARSGSESSPDYGKPFVNAMVNASSEAQGFKTTFWLISLLGIGLITFVLSVQRKKKREQN